MHDCFLRLVQLAPVRLQLSVWPSQPRWCALMSLRPRARNSAATHPGLYVHADAHACITGRSTTSGCDLCCHTHIHSFIPGVHRMPHAHATATGG